MKRRLHITNAIDFENSSVYCLDDYSIYINPARDKAKILDTLMVDLEDTLKQYDVKPIFYKCHEIYTGNKTELAPDLLFEINDGSNKWERSTDLSQPLVFKPNLSGIHDRYGIFVAYGPQINKVLVLPTIQIYDIAPTILHMFDAPIHKEVDGRVLKEIFVSSSTFLHKKIRYQEVSMKRAMRQRIQVLKSRNRL